MRYLKTLCVSLAAVWATGCGEQAAPTASLNGPEPTLTASASSGFSALELTCFAGPCEGATGLVNETYTKRPVEGAAPGFGIAPEGVYTIRGAPANTTYLVQRAFDLVQDGNCTGAFTTWPYPPGQPPGPDAVRLTTSAAGAGAAHFRAEFPFGAKGLTSDAVFRLFEESPNPGGTDIRTACVQVTTR